MKNKTNQIILILFLLILPFVLHAKPLTWKIGIVPVIPLNSNSYNILWGFEISNNSSNNNNILPNIIHPIIKLSGRFGSANALEKISDGYTTIYGISLLKTNIKDFTSTRTITNVKTTYLYVELMYGLQWEFSGSDNFSNGIDLMAGIGYSAEYFSGKLFSTENYDLGYIAGFELPLYLGYYISPTKIFEKPLYITTGIYMILTGGKGEVFPNWLYWIKFGAGVFI